MHLVGFIIRIYHDARSSERQIGTDLIEISIKDLALLFLDIISTKTNPPSYDRPSQVIKLEELQYQFIILYPCRKHKNYCKDSLMG